MLETVKNVCAVLLSLVTLGGIAWAFGESTGYRPWLLKEQNDFTGKQFQVVMEQSQQNTRALVQFKFEELLGLMKLGGSGLTWDQKVSMCSYAYTLGYTVTDESAREICDKEGQPVVIFNSIK